jgi:hypothetical protein
MIDRRRRGLFRDGRGRGLFRRLRRGGALHRASALDAKILIVAELRSAVYAEHERSYSV